MPRFDAIAVRVISELLRIAITISDSIFDKSPRESPTMACGVVCRVVCRVVSLLVCGDSPLSTVDFPSFFGGFWPFPRFGAIGAILARFDFSSYRDCRPLPTRTNTPLCASSPSSRLDVRIGTLYSSAYRDEEIHPLTFTYETAFIWSGFRSSDSNAVRVHASLRIVTTKAEPWYSKAMGSP